MYEYAECLPALFYFILFFAYLLYKVYHLYLSVYLCVSVWLLIFISTILFFRENTNTILPVHSPRGCLAEQKVSCLGALVGHLGGQGLSVEKMNLPMGLIHCLGALR